MNQQVNISKTKLRYILAMGLAATTLAAVLAYTAGGQAFLLSPDAEQGHNLVMSLLSGLQIYNPQMHDDSMPQIQGMEGQMSDSPMHGLIGNNILGGQGTLPAGGLAAVVVIGAVILSVAAFVLSWRSKSFAVGGLLAASGVILMIPPLIALVNVNFTVTTFERPLVGVTFGFVILGLGIAKGIETTRGLKKRLLSLANL